MAYTDIDYKTAPDVGNFPKKFPRDIVEIDTFLEHLLLGQVLEPLVTADRLGNIQAGLATTWLFSPNGKELSMKINTNKRFSTGKKIKVEDVVFSISRHLEDKSSQTHKFLNSVKRVEAVDKNWIKIVLKEKRVAIIKVLSRDQLGIVPNGWEFDKSSPNPYIGTGAYTLTKKLNHWYLVKNDYFDDFTPDMVKIWKIKQVEMPGLANYLPFTTKEVLEKYKLETNGSKNKEVAEQLSFVQSSYWWYPGGENYNNENKRKFSVSFISELINANLKKNGFQAATGVIPVGIAGHLKSRPSLQILSSSEIKKLSKSIKEIKIACPDNIYKSHFETPERELLEKKYGIKLIVKQIALIGRHKKVDSYNPDLVLIRWAGGFNDPEGFLAILDKALGVPLVEFYKPFGELYIKAKKEEDWKKRNSYFEEMGQMLILAGKMIPAWKTPIYRYLSKEYKLEELIFRYSPRFSDVRKVKN